MSKLTIVQIEIEDDGQSMMAAVLGVYGTPGVAPANRTDAIETHSSANAIEARRIAPAPLESPKRRGRAPKALTPPEPKRAAKASGSPKKETEATPAPKSDGSSISDRILAALAKKPMSSKELIDQLGLAPGQVYGACHLLKKEGRVESRRDDERDGLPRYFRK